MLDNTCFQICEKKHMNCQSFCIFFLIILTLFNSEVKSSEELPQKTYIRSSDLHITDERMYLYDINEGYLPVDAIFSDDCGIYVIKLKESMKPEVADDKCFNKHKIWCWRCLGCANVYCRFRCKCVEWPIEVSK